MRSLDTMLPWLACATLAVVLPGCSRETDSTAPTSALHFTDVTKESGLTMVTTSGRTPSTQILEVKGGGVALIDHDGDGDSDIFVPNGATLDSPGSGPGCRLFENLGGLRFRDVTAQAGLTFDRWGYGAIVADYDGDGDQDIHVTCFGRNALLRNDGSGRFTEVTEAAGVVAEAWSTASAFGDIDGDGDLDLYVANFLDFDPARPPPRVRLLGAEVFAGPRGLEPAPDMLFENLGDGTFRDVTASSGIGEAPPSYGLGVVILDLDGDHRPEIYVGNDSQPNFVFKNLGRNRFAERGVTSGLALNGEGEGQATMGIAIADVVGNGHPDLFTTNFMSDVNTLHVNLGGLEFEDRTAVHRLALVSRPYLGWATGFQDFDHDADEDLVVFNGHVYPEEITRPNGWEHRQTPQLFERVGRHFSPATAARAGSWLASKHCDRSCAFGDLDHDGDIDMVVTELNGPVRILRNDRNGGNWIIVRLADHRPGRHGFGLGSRIELRAADHVQRRWIVSGTSFLASSEPIAHFGLPDGVKTVELEITWPDGTRQIAADVPTGGRRVIERRR